MSKRLALLTLLVALAAFPASAAATPQPDRVIDEVSLPMGVGIDGPVVAWAKRRGTLGAQVVVRDGSRPRVLLSAGLGSSLVDVGRDRRGRRVVVFTRCGGRCDIVSFSLASRSTRVVVPGVRATDVTVGAGRVFWADGRRVRSRSLEGGRVRFEAVAGRMQPSELDTDGKTLAVTGPVPFDSGNGATGLSVTRPGSGRARLRGRRAFGEEYAALRAPVVAPEGVVTLFDDFTAGIAPGWADFAAGQRGFTKRTSGGMGIVAWDAGAGSAVLVEAPTDAGCALGDAFSEQRVGDAPCRVVIASTEGERLLPPRIAVAENTATVQRTTLDGQRITGRTALPGVPVELIRSGQVVERLITDAQGRVALPASTGGDPLGIVALTEPRSYAFRG